MRRRPVIIAAITLNLFAFPMAGHAGDDDPAGFSTYRVQIEVTRNGVPICAQDATVAAGQSLEVEPSREASASTLRVLQRVTKFPGAADSRALIEVQVFRTDGPQQRLVVAPTLGVELGEPEIYEVKTGHGVVRITTIVEGDEEEVPGDPDGTLFETVPMGSEGL